MTSISVQIKKAHDQRIALAWATVMLTTTFQDAEGKPVEAQLTLKNFSVCRGKDGNAPWVGFPKEKGQDDQYYKTIIPNKGAQAEITRAVLDAYRKDAQ